MKDNNEEALGIVLSILEKSGLNINCEERQVYATDRNKKAQVRMLFVILSQNNLELTF